MFGPYWHMRNIAVIQRTCNSGHYIVSCKRFSFAFSLHGVSKARNHSQPPRSVFECNVRTTFDAVMEALPEHLRYRGLSKGGNRLDLGARCEFLSIVAWPIEPLYRRHKTPVPPSEVSPEPIRVAVWAFSAYGLTITETATGSL